MERVRLLPLSFLLMARRYYVYLLTNRTCSTLYTGITNDLKRRVWEHKQRDGHGFTARYGVDRLVYYEAYGDIHDALRREKQIKAGSRAKKMRLIDAFNPEWRDLAADFDARSGP